MTMMKLTRKLEEAGTPLSLADIILSLFMSGRTWLASAI